MNTDETGKVASERVVNNIAMVQDWSPDGFSTESYWRKKIAQEIIDFAATERLSPEQVPHVIIAFHRAAQVAAGLSPRTRGEK